MIFIYFTPIYKSGGGEIYFLKKQFHKAESSNATHARDDDQIHAHKYFFVNLMIKGD